MTIKSTLLSCGIACLVAVPASAVTFDIEATVSNGAYAGQSVLGQITWDDSLLTGVGNEALSVAGNAGAVSAIADPTFSISFDVGGNTISHTNDISYPNYPAFEFVDGNLDFIDFMVVDGTNGADLNPWGVQALTLMDDVSFDGSMFNVGVQVIYQPRLGTTPVPLPATAPLLVGALGVLVWRRRKAAS